MSEWLDNQKKPTSNFLKLLQEHIEKTNSRCELSADEAKRLARLEAIADKLRHGENVQNMVVREKRILSTLFSEY